MTTHNPATNPKYYDLPRLKSESARISTMCETLLMTVPAGEMKALLEELEEMRQDAARFRYLCRYAETLDTLNRRSGSPCNGKENPPTTSPATLATESPGSGLAKG